MNKTFFKSGWMVVKFGDIAQNVTVRVNPSEVETDIYVGLEHLDPDTIHLRQWGHPSDVTGQKFVFKKGDVIFGRRRAYQRKLAIAEFDGICSAHAMVLRAKPKMILPEFLPFFLLSDMFMERAIEISVGSLSPTINWKTLSVQEFPLPPLEEQKRIAEILWAADEAVEKWHLAFRANEKLSQVISINSFLLHEVVKKHPTIPDDWKIGSIDRLAEVDPKQPKGIDEKLKISFITMEDISENGRIIKKEEKSFSEIKKGYTYFAENDILFAKITPCMENNKGAIAENLSNQIGMGSTEFFVLRPKNSLDKKFLYCLTMSQGFRKRAESWMQGSAGQRRVPKDFFTKRPIALPPQQKRIEIGEVLYSLDLQAKEIIVHVKKGNLIISKMINKLFPQVAI